MRTLIAALGSVFLGALLVGACGDSSDSSSQTPGESAGGNGGAGAGAGGVGGKGGTGSAGKGGSAGASGGQSGGAGESAGGAAGGEGGQGGSDTAGQGGSDIAGSAGAAGGCSDGLTLCGDVCVDTATNPKHCGDCATSCPEAPNTVVTCEAGACSSACLAGALDCNKNAADGCEINSNNDKDNCGTCGTVCPGGGGVPGQCSLGVCGLACEAGKGDCNKNAADGCEASLDSDPKNCGACGLSCGGGACVQGACSCAGSTQTAQLLPLDMYIMQDRSGSMLDETSKKNTKWDALKAAMTAFLGDPGTSGIGVGVQFFPTVDPSLPEPCSSNAVCGSYGPCVTINGCSNSVGTLTTCTTKNDCNVLGPGGKCQPVGQCANDNSYACFPQQTPNCGVDAQGKNLGACVAIPSFCEGNSCNVSVYTAPAVGIAPLPGSKNALLAAFNGTQPSGTTPTLPALQGAVQYTTNWLSKPENSDHTAVVVLATDGLPNGCNSTVASVAAEASKGNSASPRVRTFVIGIFNDTDLAAGAQQNLDTIAKAGGGQDKAIIVNTGSDVTQQFLDALNKIRQATLACQYKLPVPQDGSPFDSSKVNVIFSDASGNKKTIFYVGSEASCDPVSGGWYYDNPANPTKILTCPATCNAFQSGAGSKVDIQVGCATVKP